MTEESVRYEDWIELVDLSSIPDPDDKYQECEFFFDLLETEKDRNHFRWLASAFLNAIYSYFETSALTAHFRFMHPEINEPIEDSEGLATLRKYVNVVQNNKNPKYVKTCAVHPIVKQIYELRKKCTHHFSLSIMEAGPQLPRDFLFGSIRGKGESALMQCQRAIELVRVVQKELDS